MKPGYELKTNFNGTDVDFKIKDFLVYSKEFDFIFVPFDADTRRRFQRLKNLQFSLVDDDIEKDDTVFITQRPFGMEPKLGFGTVNRVEGKFIYHTVRASPGSSGSPITNQHSAVVGIHKGISKKTKNEYAV